MTIKKPLPAIVLGLVLTACAPQSDERAPITDSPIASPAALDTVQTLDGNVDTACFENVVASSWHDDPEMDPSTVIAAAGNDQAIMNQTAIDTLIDVTLLSDDTCSTVIESVY